MSTLRAGVSEGVAFALKPEAREAIDFFRFQHAKRPGSVNLPFPMTSTAGLALAGESGRRSGIGCYCDLYLSSLRLPPKSNAPKSLKFRPLIALGET